MSSKSRPTDQSETQALQDSTNTSDNEGRRHETPFAAILPTLPCAYAEERKAEERKTGPQHLPNRPTCPQPGPVPLAQRYGGGCPSRPVPRRHRTDRCHPSDLHRCPHKESALARLAPAGQKQPPRTRRGHEYGYPAGSRRVFIDASVHIPAHDRHGLERLLRYCARPPFAAERISLVNQEQRKGYPSIGPRTPLAWRPKAPEQQPLSNSP